MEEKKQKNPQNFLVRFANLFKSKCPKCGQILKRSTVSVRNEKGRIKPMKICPDCGHKQ